MHAERPILTCLQREKFFIQSLNPNCSFGGLINEMVQELFGGDPHTVDAFYLCQEKLRGDSRGRSRSDSRRRGGGRRDSRRRSAPARCTVEHHAPVAQVQQPSSFAQPSP